MIEFAPSAPFTVGLEEELLLVDPETLALVPTAADVLARLDAGRSVGHEAYAAELELRSAPALHVSAAVDELQGLRAHVAGAGATLLGAGVHPAGAHGDAALVDSERYRQVDDAMRGLIRRTPECALHVHVGVLNVETAIRVFNGLREWLPLLQGLAANSPWWFGSDSGLASARAALVRAYPGRGIPRALRDADDWDDLVAATTAAGGLADYTFLWWDLRLHPRHGTVEVRELDAQSSLDHVAGLAVLIRALACEAAQLPPRAGTPSEILAWSSFRAMRDGVEATILDTGVLAPLREIARSTVERLRPIARELGDEDALDAVAGILASGGGAGRRRRAFAEGGLRLLLEQLVEETARRDEPLPSNRGLRPSSERPEPTVASRWLDARSRCDLDELAALTAEQAVWASPVVGEVRGREAVVEQIRAGFTDADEFGTELLSFETRGEKAVAVIRNTGRRNGQELDSLQSLFLQTAGGSVTSVRVAVDDPEAIETFWSD
ncbi:MAG: YbdK family carboxylate-amine ligase [Gaiella sp.]